MYSESSTFLFYIYFQTSLKKKSTTDSLALSLISKKSILKKISFQNILNLIQIEKELGDFLDPKNPTTEKFTLNFPSN